MSANSISLSEESDLIDHEHKSGYDHDPNDISSGDTGNKKESIRPQIVVERQKQKQQKELGGILVYDSQARIEGNQRMEEYYKQNPAQITTNHILFSKEEHNKVTEEFFSRVPRERDFQTEQEKMFYYRLQRFNLSQRQLKAETRCQLEVPSMHHCLIFDSKFESGNLRKAAKVNNIEYNLWLENDYNTKGHTQWYFFKVSYQSDKAAKITFNILNLAKTYSLYKQGMKPVIFSMQNFKRMYPEYKGSNPLRCIDGWQRGGENIRYEPNEIARFESSQKFTQGDRFLQNQNGHGEGIDYFFTFSFDYRFEHCEDEVWFAHAIPYTYTELSMQLRTHLEEDQKKEQQEQIMKAEILCNSLQGRPVPLITITENAATYQDYSDSLLIQTDLAPTIRKQFKAKYQQCRKLLKQAAESKPKVQKLLEAAFEEECTSFYEATQQGFQQANFSENWGQKLLYFLRDHSHKKAVVITSRVHPGEPQASFMFNGTLQFLLSDSDLAKELRKNFVFKMVPMLNPDGVIIGNYRCSLLGQDLNRKWVMPNKYLHPSIYYTKQLIRYLQWERKVILFVDMHGHSRKQNVFFYGCCYKNFENEGRIKNAQLRILPLLCCHKNQNFSFAGSTFRIEKAKESTGRVVIFKDFNIMNSFTLECSFHGRQLKGENKPTHFTTLDMQEIGKNLAETLESYLPREQHKLNIIGGKILDIFYEEFVKFVPAYILKREEEKKVELDHSPSQQQISSAQLMKQRVGQKNQTTSRKPPTQSYASQNKNFKFRQVQNHKPGEATDPSDQEQGFSDVIAFNDRKDNQNLELNELELFINRQYKSKNEYPAQDVGDSSDDAKSDNSAWEYEDEEPTPTFGIQKKPVKKIQYISGEKQKKSNSSYNPSRKVLIEPKQIISTKERDKVILHQVQFTSPVLNENQQATLPIQQVLKVNELLQKRQAEAKLYKSRQSQQQLQIDHLVPATTPNGSRNLQQKQQVSIVEYVVDGKRIRVQKDINQNTSPSFQPPQRRKETQPLPYQSQQDHKPNVPTLTQVLLQENVNEFYQLQALDKPSTAQVQQQYYTNTNVLQGHGLIKRMPDKEKHQIKSFSEYAEKVHSLKQSGSQTHLLQPLNAQSPLKMQKDPREEHLQQQQSEHNLRQKRKKINIGQELKKQQQFQVSTQQTPQRGKKYLIQEPHIAVQDQEQEQQKVKSKIDRESIIGVGFQIKMNKPAQSRQQEHSKSIEQHTFKKKLKESQSATKHLITSPRVEDEPTRFSSLAQQENKGERLFVRTKDGMQHFTLTKEQPKQQIDQKTFNSITFSTQSQAPNTGLRSHLKHKRNVQVPLPLHQQERLQAQEQNQLRYIQESPKKQSNEVKRKVQTEQTLLVISPRQTTLQGPSNSASRQSRRPGDEGRSSPCKIISTTPTHQGVSRNIKLADDVQTVMQSHPASMFNNAQAGAGGTAEFSGIKIIKKK